MQGTVMGTQRGGTGRVARQRGVRSWAHPADLLFPQSGQKCRSWEMLDEKCLGGTGMGRKADVLGGGPPRVYDKGTWVQILQGRAMCLL